MNLENLRHLQTALARIDDLIRVAVARVQDGDHIPHDALRGLVITPQEVEKYLNQEPLASLWDADTGFAPPQPLILDQHSRFARLINNFALTQLDSYIIMLCLAPALDRRYERLYAFLQDDVNLRYPTVNLMMNLLGSNEAQRFAVWGRLMEQQPLRHHHLISCEPNPSRPQSVFLAHHLKLDERVVAYLLGSDHPDTSLEGLVTVGVQHPGLHLPEAALLPIHEALPYKPMIYLHGKPESGQRETAALLCEAQDLAIVCVDLTQLDPNAPDFDTDWQLAFREGYLNSAALLLDGWQHIVNEHGHAPRTIWKAIRDYPQPIFICGTEEWEPQDTHRERRLLRVSFDTPPYPDRLATWEHLAQSNAVQTHNGDLQLLATKFRFTHGQIARVFQTATDLAASRGANNAALDDLYAGAQAHSKLRMGHLAERIIPRYDWDDLILPPDQLAQLKEISARARFGHVVRDEWGFGRKVGGSRGISSLFAGESGTGKTLAAEVLANDLGLLLYKIDLASVVSKYIGETEKNLGRIFVEARASNAILFFDEADALFGKRSEVKDARDRYANIEVAYLLQQIETYDGISILATNLRQNLDEAFTRRLDFLVDFPFPDEDYRTLIWQLHFPTEAPVAPTVNLQTIAARYKLAGGNIRNAALAAAFLAAEQGAAIDDRHIRHAVRREHQKMGRLFDDE